MTYVLPTFNLTINLWHNATWSPTIPPIPVPDLVIQGNLALGKRVTTSGAIFGSSMWLLVPPLTDIRWLDATGMFAAPDLIEVPAGSGRYYTVDFVDDIGKGFANEHRFAQLGQQIPWPIPTP